MRVTQCLRPLRRGRRCETSPFITTLFMDSHHSGTEDVDAALLRRLSDLAQGLLGEEDTTALLTLVVQAVVELTGAAAASICAVEDGEPVVLARSSPDLVPLEQVELTDAAGGPCLECLRLAEAVAVADLTSDDRWPAFLQLAREFGVREVHVLPLTTGRELVGALDLFGTDEPLTRRDHQVADLLGDLATVAIRYHRTQSLQQTEIDQLRLALQSRVAIEQAKGVLAEHAGLDMAGAFEVLRRYSRANRRLLHEVAAAVADRTISAEAVLAVLPRSRRG